MWIKFIAYKLLLPVKINFLTVGIFLLVLANSTNQFITLEFKTLNTECSYDYVFVYDGDSFNSPLLGSYSGKNQPQSILASSGFVSIFIEYIIISIKKQ